MLWEEVILLTERAKDRRLDMSMLFGGLHYHPPSDGRLTFDETELFWSTRFGRSRRLDISVEDLVALPMIQRLFGGCHMRDLQCLAIFRSRTTIFDRTSVDQSVHPLFTQGIPPLRVLRLSDFVFSWSEMRALA
jgi:hypothetical protein